MQYFSNLFDKVLYMFRTGPLSIIRSISTLYARNRYLSCQFFWRLLAWSEFHPDHASRREQNQHDKYLLRVYSVEVLLMMDSGPVRNMQSTLSNKFEKQYISLAFNIRIYHDARSSECHIYKCCQYIYLRHTQQLMLKFTQLSATSSMATCFSRPCDHQQANFYRSCAFNVLTIWDPVMCNINITGSHIISTLKAHDLQRLA